MDDLPVAMTSASSAREDFAASRSGPSATNAIANWPNHDEINRAGPAGGIHPRRSESNMTDASGDVVETPSTHGLVAPSRHLQDGTAAPVATSSRSVSGFPIRRIRHAEVVLVDDVCIAYGRHWLRLRWPGHKGGFAGYVALGKVNEPLPKQIANALRGTFSFRFLGGSDGIKGLIPPQLCSLRKCTFRSLYSRRPHRGFSFTYWK
jgi:hypothetical protein